jgi:protein CpxP
MKRHTTIKMIAAVTLAVTVVAAGITIRSQADEQQRPGHRRGELIERLQALGVTDEQKTQIKEILRQHQPTVQPLVQSAVTEHRALREVIRAEPVNETAIRAQSAKVAAVEADLAVARAHVVQDLRKVLTAEQIEQLKALQTDLYDRIDRLMEHARNGIAE